LLSIQEIRITHLSKATAKRAKNQQGNEYVTRDQGDLPTGFDFHGSAPLKKSIYVSKVRYSVTLRGGKRTL